MGRRQGLKVVSVIVVTCVLALVAHAAEELRISQKHKRFSNTAVTVKAGDLLTFVNDDEAMHNVYSLTEGFTFDLGGAQAGFSFLAVTAGLCGVADVPSETQTRGRVRGVRSQSGTTARPL